MAEIEIGEPEAYTPEGMRKWREEVSRKLAAQFTQRLRDYEAEHGTVTPAPKSARFKRHSTEAEIMAITKRSLLTSGWLQE